jgi:hypothetical protein
LSGLNQIQKRIQNLFGKCFEKLEKKKKERDFLSSLVLAQLSRA